MCNSNLTMIPRSFAIYDFNLITFLVMGLDTDGPLGEGTGYRNDQQMDFVTVLSFNPLDHTYTAMHLNRDSIVEIDELGVTGEQTGYSYKAQLALAHTYGNGGNLSCLNAKRAVSRMLYGLKIDYYVALSMDAISTLNDYVGGVPVTMPKDYTALDPAFVEGESVTLRGDQALLYVRSRKDTDDQTNLSRMERQKQYIDGFVKKIAALDINDDFTKGAYDAVMEPSYMMTDAGLAPIKGLMEDLKNYTFKGCVSPEGIAKVGEEYMEFYVNEDSLVSLVTDLYFEK